MFYASQASGVIRETFPCNISDPFMGFVALNVSLIVICGILRLALKFVYVDVQAKSENILHEYFK